MLARFSCTLGSEDSRLTFLVGLLAFVNEFSRFTVELLELVDNIAALLSFSFSWHFLRN